MRDPTCTPAAQDETDLWTVRSGLILLRLNQPALSDKGNGEKSHRTSSEAS
jgi:hypothetical protein